jgi:nucleoside-diphosphate-sugar epimerase
MTRISPIIVEDDKDYVTDNPHRRCPDLTKLRRLYPWQPKIALREGITRTLQSYRLIAVPERIAGSF